MTISVKKALSTQEAASTLGVAETTVKRWADEGLLPCVRTPGGHRKFMFRDIALFAEKNGYSIGGAEPPRIEGKAPERLEFALHTRNYTLAAEVFRKEALHADREGILNFLLYLYRHQVPLKVIMDQVVQPAFAAIGTMWEEGRLEINQEHAATAATLEALVRLAPELHRKEFNGRSAVCACLEGELHELGLRGLAYSLEVEGWKVFYIGTNTPAETLRTYVRAAGPDMVCISVTAPGAGRQFFPQLHKLTEEAHAYGGKVIAGGSGAGSLQAHAVKLDLIAPSIEEAVGFSRDVFNLKPGPKKRRENDAKTRNHTHQ